MKQFKILYEHYSLLKNQLNNSEEDITTNLLEYGIKEDYFDNVNRATELLYKFYNVKLVKADIRNALSYKLNDNHSENVKMCLLIDVLRSYDGLGHPTSFTTPEGIALLVLMDKFIGNHEIEAYGRLGKVTSATLSLIDVIPSLSDCSDVLGNKYALYLPSILAKKAPDTESLYRQYIYRLCKTIAEVDGEISVAEEEWLREIALLNDDDPNNDVEISGL